MVFLHYVDSGELQKAAEVQVLWLKQPEPEWDNSCYEAALLLRGQRGQADVKSASLLLQTLFAQFRDAALSDVEAGKREKAYLLCVELSRSFGDGFEDEIATIRKGCTLAFPATGVMNRTDDASDGGVTQHIHNKSKSKSAIVYIWGYIEDTASEINVRVFLRPYDSHTITFAPGSYSASVMVGEAWFGEKELFGEKSGSIIGVDITKTNNAPWFQPNTSDSMTYMKGGYNLTIPE